MAYQPSWVIECRSNPCWRTVVVVVRNYGVDNFPKGITTKVDVIAPLEFEFQHVDNCATGTVQIYLFLCPSQFIITYQSIDPISTSISHPQSLTTSLYIYIALSLSLPLSLSLSIYIYIYIYILPIFVHSLSFLISVQ